MENKKEYIITGAAGFLGSNVAHILLNRGESVRAFVLKGDPAVKKIPNGIKIYYGDIADKNSLNEVFSVDNDKDLIVIHCASIVTVDDHYSKLLYNVNVNGTKNIVDKCVETNVKKLVYISSTSAIPEVKKNKDIVEVNHFSPDKIVGHYGKSKAMATQIVMDAINDQNLDASIIFPSGICGPDDYAFGPVSSFLIDYVKGNMPAGIEGSFNAVDVRDLAEGVISCVSNGRKGEGYILANELVTMREMFDLISQESGCKNVKTIIPQRIAKILARINFVVTKITKKDSNLTPFAVYNLSRNNKFSTKKAEAELGFKIRPFSQTIRDEIIWLNSINKISIDRNVLRTKEVV